jgi:SNF family Na+-dependent transporter
MRIVIPGITSLIALVFAVALVDQWRVRRHAFQLSWAIGMLFFGIASGCETIAAASGWNEPLYRTW